MKNSRVYMVRLATLAMMAAVSCVLVLIVTVPFPLFPAFRYDLADVPILITTFLFGPVYGVALTAFVSLIQAFVLGQDGWLGAFMHVCATGGFAIVAGLIYRRNKTRKSAIIALVAGTFFMTFLMCILNYIMDPLFYGMPQDAVAALMLPAIIPFNLSKAGLNSLITFIIYKRISKMVHKAEMKES